MKVQTRLRKRDSHSNRLNAEKKSWWSHATKMRWMNKMPSKNQKRNLFVPKLRLEEMILVHAVAAKNTRPVTEPGHKCSPLFYKILPGYLELFLSFEFFSSDLLFIKAELGAAVVPVFGWRAVHTIFAAVSDFCFSFSGVGEAVFVNPN